MIVSYELAIPEMFPFDFQKWIISNHPSSLQESSKNMTTQRANLSKTVSVTRAFCERMDFAISTKEAKEKVFDPTIAAVQKYIKAWYEYLQLLIKTPVLVDQYNHRFTWRSILENRKISVYGKRYTSTNVHFETTMLHFLLASLQWQYAKALKRVCTQRSGHEEAVLALKYVNGCGNTLETIPIDPSLMFTRRRVFDHEHRPPAPIHITQTTGDDDDDESDENACQTPEQAFLALSVPGIFELVKYSTTGSTLQYPPELSKACRTSLCAMYFAERAELCSIILKKKSGPDIERAKYYLTSALCLQGESLNCKFVRHWMVAKRRAALYLTWLCMANLYKKTTYSPTLIKSGIIAQPVASVFQFNPLIPHAIFATHCAIQYAPNATALAELKDELNSLVKDNLMQYKMPLFESHLYLNQTREITNDPQWPVDHCVKIAPALEMLTAKFNDILHSPAIAPKCRELFHTKQ